MKIILWSQVNLHASHSLCVREEPHPHVWSFEVGFSGLPKDGMILDLVRVEKDLQEWSDRLTHRYLNDASDLGEDARKFPTNENLGIDLARWLTAQKLPIYQALNPSVRLDQIRATLFEVSGAKVGAAELFF